ncbi:MAG: hypothetical protein ACLU5E_01285 [Anaerovoracaceae bacterium]
MIDEKKLIEKTEHYIKRYLEPPYGREIEGTVELLKEVKDVLSEQPKAGAWIPCGEKLPKLGADVEVTTDIRDRSIGYYADGFWWDSIDGDRIDVIAWKEPSDPWEGEYK